MWLCWLADIQIHLRGINRGILDGRELAHREGWGSVRFWLSCELSPIRGVMYMVVRCSSSCLNLKSSTRTSDAKLGGVDRELVMVLYGLCTW